MRIAFTLTLKRLLGLAVFGVFAALVVGWSGLVSIAASSGHYGPVEWFLHFTMRQAVATQSTGLALPEDVRLSDPSLVQRASGHFATGCAPCHGAPGVNQSPVVEAMMPPPPRLEDKVGAWRDRELFWIGQHGIKYSGMPAWVTQERPDEVWAMVAFLRALPDMSAEDYAALALGGQGAATPPPMGAASKSLPAMAEIALADCARCHGRDGQGTAARIAMGETAGAFPIIAGQPETYLLATLKAFAAGTRHSGYMQPPARRYDETVLASLAAHYAAQPAQAPSAAPVPAPLPEGLASPDGATAASPTAPGLPETATTALPAPIPPDEPARAASREALARVVPVSAAYGPPYDRAGLLDLGRVIATQGLPARKLPACESCHGRAARDTAAPEAEAQRNAHYPYLSGQPAWYLSTHLNLWKHDARDGTPYAHLMDKIAIHMTDEQIAAVSAWYSERAAGE